MTTLVVALAALCAYGCSDSDDGPDGTGGTGNDTGTGGVGGDPGGECVASDCPAPEEECTVAVCINDACGTDTAPDQTRCDLDEAIEGWCEDGVCVELPACDSDEDCGDARFVCNDENVCERLPAPDPVTMVLEAACATSAAGADVFVHLPVEITVAPLGPIVPGTSFDAEVSTKVPLSADIVAIIQAIGLPEVAYTGRGVQIIAASGATGDSVLSDVGSGTLPIPAAGEPLPDPLPTTEGSTETVTYTVNEDAAEVVFSFDGFVGEGAIPGVGSGEGESKTGVIVEVPIIGELAIPCVPGQWTPAGGALGRPLVPPTVNLAFPIAP